MLQGTTRAKYLFAIFDAKYYNLQLERGKKLRGQPGIESVTKQYLYQLAFRPFVEAHHFDAVHNCFLFPTVGDTVINKGVASLDMLSQLGLKDIQLRMIPAKKAYGLYLQNRKFDIRDLDLAFYLPEEKEPVHADA